MKPASKHWAAAIMAAVLVSLGACGKAQQPDYLPWQIEQTTASSSKVFHLELGKSTLKDAIQTWQHFPELAVFVDAKQQKTLEAYFGRKLLGVFEAKLITELDADAATLDQMAANGIERKAQPSGSWRLTPSEPDTKRANDLLIKYLIYMPTADYNSDIILKQFGEPKTMKDIKANAQYWFYPDKSLVLLLNSDGSDIFYYSTPAHYAALAERLMSQKEISNHEQ